MRLESIKPERTSTNMIDRNTYTIVGSIFLALFGLVTYRLFSRTPPPPPGPPGKLISGNVHLLPKSDVWRTYAKLAEIYGQSAKSDTKARFLTRIPLCGGLTGPVISLRYFNKRYVVLNSAKAAVDLLEARSSIYSDRPMVGFIICTCLWCEEV